MAAEAKRSIGPLELEAGESHALLGPKRAHGSLSSYQAGAAVIKAIMGAGSFALPWAFSKTGWVVGPAALLTLMWLSVCSIKMLVHCRRICERGQYAHDGSRIVQRPQLASSYVDVAQCAFGRAGSLLVYICSIFASVGVCGSYLVFIAANFVSVLPDGAASQSTLVACVLPFAVGLSAVRDQSMFAFTALLGDVSVCLGMLVVLVFGLFYAPHALGEGCVGVASVETMPLAFGAVGFLFFIHFLVIPIELSMARPAEFNKMVDNSFLACAIVSASFGVLGYLLFGVATKQIVILNVQGSMLVVCVKLLLCVDLFFTYPVVMRPSIDIVQASVARWWCSSGDSATMAQTRRSSGRSWPVQDGGAVLPQGPAVVRGSAAASAAAAAAAAPLAPLESPDTGAAAFAVDKCNNLSQIPQLTVCLVLGALAASAALFVPAFGLLSGLVGGVAQAFLGFVMPPLMLQRLAQRSWWSAAGVGAAAMAIFGMLMIIWTVCSTLHQLHVGAAPVNSHHNKKHIGLLLL